METDWNTQEEETEDLSRKRSRIKERERERGGRERKKERSDRNWQRYSHRDDYSDILFKRGTI